MNDHMEIFPWDDNFATGIDEVDAQHKQLVELLNRLVSHLTYNVDMVELSSIFDQLKGYAVMHFRYEEALWDSAFAGDDWVENHKNAHASFVHDVERLQAESDRRPFDEVIENIAGFLTHWLALHILESDRRFSHVLHGVRQGFSIEEAKRYADEMMSGATRMMIETIMTMYDKLANRTVQFSREISKRKRIELKLKQALDDLRHTKELADSANRAKSAFMADLIHDIRQPAQDIFDAAQDMRSEKQDYSPSRHLDRLDAAVGRLSKAMENLLELSGRNDPGGKE